jgi:hypothetical protein
MAETDYFFEQYKILWDTFNGELQRFWVRFNVLISLELAGFYIFMKELAIFKSNEAIFGLSLLIMTSFSLLIVLIVWRAIGVYKLLVKLINEFEVESNETVYLISSMKRLSDRENIDNTSAPKQMYYALNIAFFFFIGWFFSLLYKLMA